ncbi:hypothetical protein Hanom_Chr13g01183321 [Helianthus anomalus]
MGYGGVWVVAFVDTWNGSPPPLKPTPMGYGGAWVGGMSLVWPLRARHVTLLALLARPTPGFKPTPMGLRPKPTPQPKPPGWWLGRFQPTHAPTQAPYPMA